MEINESVLNAMAEEINVSRSHINIYYDILTRIPCVCDGQKYQLLNCLYSLINSRKNNPCKFNSDEFSYLLSDALFKTYKEKAIPYLTLYYIAVNDVQIREIARTLKKKNLN